MGWASPASGDSSEWTNVMQISVRARTVLNEALVCDLTLPWGAPNPTQDGVLARFADAGFDFVSLTMATDSSWIDETIRTIAAVRATIRKGSHEARLRQKPLPTSRPLNRDGKLAIGLNFQGTNPFQGSLAMVPIYYDLGVRHALWRTISETSSATVATNAPTKG